MPDYYDVLSAMHRALKPSAYLEIGVRNGDSFRLSLPETVCIGVDPCPSECLSLDNNQVIEVSTSDDFFNGKRLSELLSGRSLDLAFVDGMHLFEFALRDFINIELSSHSETIVVVHDCLPRDAATSSRDRLTDFWTGDVWRLVLCLLDLRPDLEIVLLDTPPSGLCLIRGLDPSSRLLTTNYNSIVNRYLEFGFEEWTRRWTETSLLIRNPSVAADFAVGAPIPPLARPNATDSVESRRIARSTPRLLGVLLCYNDADVLPDVIRSLAENGHDIVAWDHGSTDNTAAVLEEYRDVLVETRFVPREFDFYELYPAMSRHLISDYASRYDWISWPDDDEVLEGPDRMATYRAHLEELFFEGYDWIQFDNYNFWTTEEDDPAVVSPAARIHRYCIFPECAPRIRSWRATVTNIREFNHNPLVGIKCPRNFKLRHYPARTKARLYRRIFMDRAGLQREGQNVHYGRLLRNLSKIAIRPEQLLFDDRIGELSPTPVFDWMSVYGESHEGGHSTGLDASPATPAIPRGYGSGPPATLDDLVVDVGDLIVAGDIPGARARYLRFRPEFESDPLIRAFDETVGRLET